MRKANIVLKGYYPFATSRGKGAKGTVVYKNGKVVDRVVSNPTETAKFYRRKGYSVRIS